jgi:hypothetical protein
MNPRWDEEEALGESVDLLVECGERGRSCWALRAVLDEVIARVGPWWLANFIATTPNKPAASAMEEYLATYWPAYAESVEQLIAASNWTKDANSMAKEFGED